MKGLVLPNDAAFLQRMGVGKTHQLKHRTNFSNEELYRILQEYAKEIKTLNE